MAEELSPHHAASAAGSDGAKLTPNAPNEGGRIGSLDYLRAFASLFVAWNHFTVCNGNLVVAPGWIHSLLYFPGFFKGKCVLLFFVISGCVYYFLLKKLPHNVRTAGVFIQRAGIRLYLPYLAAILLAIGFLELGAHNPFYRTPPPGYDWRDIAHNVLMLAGFTDADWLGPVFWNLPIQMQFIACAGVLWACCSSLQALRLANLALLGLSLIPVHPGTFLHYFPLFALGFCYYLIIDGQARWYDWVATAGLLAWVALRFEWQAGLLTALPLLLNWLRLPRLRLVVFLGGISYSLYLTHTLVGARTVNFLSRYLHGEWGAVATCLAAIGVSIAFAWVFHVLVERRCHEAARRVMKA